MLCPSQSFRIPLARREESFSLSKAPASPPLPPLCKGGKGIARSRRHSIARNKNTRLEIVPPALSTPTFHRPSLTLHPIASAPARFPSAIWPRPPAPNIGETRAGQEQVGASGHEGCQVAEARRRRFRRSPGSARFASTSHSSGLEDRPPWRLETAARFPGGIAAGDTARPTRACR